MCLSPLSRFPFITQIDRQTAKQAARQEENVTTRGLLTPLPLCCYLTLCDTAQTPQNALIQQNTLNRCFKKNV